MSELLDPKSLTPEQLYELQSETWAQGAASAQARMLSVLEGDEIWHSETLQADLIAVAKTLVDIPEFEGTLEALSRLGIRKPAFAADLAADATDPVFAYQLGRARRELEILDALVQANKGKTHSRGSDCGLCNAIALIKGEVDG